jgi:hypothetical protein
MSNLFQRPTPATATIDDVRKALEEIVAWDWKTGYTFAHIVIDDHNLGDGSILYCLRPAWIAEVMTQKIKDHLRGHDMPSLEDMEPWQLQIYRQPIQQMAEVIDLLNWLLDVPEDVRDDAYHNDEDGEAGQV